MNLKTYLAEHKQVDLARQLGVTQGAVHQWAVGLSRPSAERSIQIEKATAGAVRCEDLRPDVDWAYLRGTTPTPQAPATAGSDIATAAAGKGA
ncbi:helix-turn-helix domain-containing protein [Malikia sp.]|uniref:transcriptional regulator n=1 Tax=Malikia sp. TaxID=2070706 RepID=UPI002625E1EE|nr:helix-turn-helix domain-containing protein [Malikia sp.]MDD2728192.1 helix-turn-helix domain-containing protein [Malikia sp.]